MRSVCLSKTAIACARVPAPCIYDVVMQDANAYLDQVLSEAGTRVSTDSAHDVINDIRKGDRPLCELTFVKVPLTCKHTRTSDATCLAHRLVAQ